ncbi:MAG: hypothetical protein HFG20_04370 [Anaerotruncus sp.]|nr:hypothetical protein [Anaerotruncus sp.]
MVYCICQAGSQSIFLMLWEPVTVLPQDGSQRLAVAIAQNLSKKYGGD